MVGCPDGDVLVAGLVSTGVQHAVLARDAPSGARRWLKVIDSSNTTADYLDELTVDGAGNAVVTFTHTVDPGVSSTIVACRYSPTGRRLWRRTLDGGAGAMNSAAGLAVNSAGDVYIGGSVTVPGPAQGSLVARLRARDGAVVMRSMQSGVGKLEVCTAIAVDAKGYSYATGYGDRGDGKTQAVTVKVNPGGGVSWLRAFPGAGDYATTGSRIVLGAGGRLYVAARQRLAGPTSTLIVLRYSTGGALQWSDAWDVPGGNMDGVSAVATDRSGNLFLAGEAATSGPAPSHAFVARWTPSKARWTWVKPDTDDNATNLDGVVVDQAGGCWAAGSCTFAFHTGDDVSALYAVRISKSGAPRWERAEVRIDRRLYGLGLAGCSGGLAAVGWSSDEPDYDAWVMKIRK